MCIRVQILIESDQEEIPPHVEEVACFERDQLAPETLGLRLEEAKQMLGFFAYPPEMVHSASLRSILRRVSRKGYVGLSHPSLDLLASSVSPVASQARGEASFARRHAPERPVSRWD